MLIFATSDKGGTGRSVTGCNLAYRCALQGLNVCYADFDFGSPTAGAIFEVEAAITGTSDGGLHSLMTGQVTDPVRLDIWAQSDRQELRGRPAGAGELVLFPGDRGGGEFSAGADISRRCANWFQRMDEEFDVCFVDLSAGRSYAIEIALEVTGRKDMAPVQRRWVVFHRWTRQHIVAAAELVYGDHGLIKTGVAHGHDEEELRDSVRFVRTAVLDPDSPAQGDLRAPQAEWLRACHQDLQQLAARSKLGRTVVLGETPMDPILQWREQLILDADVHIRLIANNATKVALEDLARKLADKTVWEVP